MIRDRLGYTPMLKAAALGRTRMVKKLIELGVDPRHTDPYGVTPREKAELYSHADLVRYLSQAEEDVRSAKMVPKVFDTFQKTS
jgi:ankyrin repeat protein